MLRFEDVSFNFSGKKIFSQLSFSLAENRILLAGKNGSGKTTLLLLASGLLIPNHGKITFKGLNVAAHVAKNSIGISADKIEIPPFFTTLSFLKFHCKMQKCIIVEELIERFSLTDFLGTKISELSLGNYKKLSLLTAFMHSPSLLILDEPYNGLDVDTKAELNKFLMDYKGQVIIASHESNNFSGKGFRHLNINGLDSD